MLLLALVGQAFADARSDLEGALLARSLGERAAAQATLVRLIRSLAAEDPLRGTALFWSATLHEESGDRDRARETLRECIRNVGPARGDCTDLLGRIELDDSRMQVPGTWDFTGEHGMVHLWTQTDRGTVQIQEQDGDPALVWTSRRNPEEPGILLFAVDSSTRPRRLTVELSTPDERAVILPLFVDERGTVRRARSPVVLTKDRVVKLALDLDDVAGLDPSQLERVVFRDLTSDATPKSTTLILDDVSLR